MSRPGVETHPSLTLVLFWYSHPLSTVHRRPSSRRLFSEQTPPPSLPPTFRCAPLTTQWCINGRAPSAHPTTENLTEGLFALRTTTGTVARFKCTTREIFREWYEELIRRVIDRVKIKKRRILRDFEVLIEKLSVKNICKKSDFLKNVYVLWFFIFDHTYKIVIVISFDLFNFNFNYNLTITS